MPWVEAGNVSLHYKLDGEGAHSLILLHELGGSLASWDAVLAFLGPEFRVLRPDLRGAGLSEKVRMAFAMADQVTDLATVLDAARLPPPWRIAGVAAGAALAIAFAAAKPGQVAALALCCPAVGVDPGRRRYLLERADRAAAEGMRAIAETSLSRSYPVEIGPSPAVRAAYRARFLANDPVCYGLANRAFAGTALDDAIAGLRCRCLVLAGTQDRLRPPETVRALADRIAGARFKMIESGHLMPVQVPATLGPRLRRFFLEAG